jgi:hypothetical protein
MVIAAIGGLLAFADAAPAATAVTACGQVYSGAGYLAADLDCTAFDGAAVTLNGGVLDLKGYSLSSTREGVVCGGNCRIESSTPGGRISSSGSDVYAVNDDFDVSRKRRAILIRGVTIENSRYGVSAHRLVLIDSIVSNMVREGVGANRAKIVNSVIDTVVDGECVSAGFSATIIGSGSVAKVVEKEERRHHPES